MILVLQSLRDWRGKKYLLQMLQDKMRMLSKGPVCKGTAGLAEARLSFPQKCGCSPAPGQGRGGAGRRELSRASVDFEQGRGELVGLVSVRGILLHFCIS